MLHGAHEDLSPGDDRRQRDHHLREDHAETGHGHLRVGVAARVREQLDVELRGTAQLTEAAQVQPVQVGRICLRGLVGEVGTHVDRVAEQQSRRHRPLEPMDRCRQEGRADGHRVGDEEEQDVAAQHPHAHPQVRPPPSTTGQDDDADAGDEHRQRG